MSFRSFLVRWQEPYVWLPMAAFLALVAWVVLTALDRTAGNDMLAMLIQLPILSAYALAALALTYLARRRQRRKLSDAEQQRLWEATVAGHKGAIIIYITDGLVWLTSFVVSLLFFWPSR